MYDEKFTELVKVAVEKLNFLRKRIRQGFYFLVVLQLV